MLKIHYEHSRELDRYTEAGARYLSRLLESSLEHGFVRIVSYPSLNAIISAATAFAGASLLKIRPLLSVSLEPPEYIEIPTLLFGYKNLPYKTGDVDAPLMAFATEIASKPVPNSYLIDGEGSTASLFGLTLLGYGGPLVRREVLAPLAASLYWGGFVDKKGNFYGLDNIFVNKVSVSDKLDLKYIASLKVYNPLKHGLCKAIASTANPFYPGLTGSEEECRSTLVAADLREYADKRIAELEESELEKISVTILARIKSEVENSGGSFEPSDYIGSILVSNRIVSMPQDYRMFGDMLLHIIESMGLGQLISLILNIDDEYTIVEKYLELYAKRLPTIIAESKPKRVKSAPWFRAYVVSAKKEDDLTLLWLALRMLRRLEDEAVLAIEEDGELIVSGIQVELSVGDYALRRLVDARVLEEVDELSFRIVRRE